MINKDTYKRLTNSNIFPCPNCIPSSIVGEDGCFIEDTATLRYCIDCPVKKIYDCLAELEDKIENGTLIELPCKVRTMVYVVDYIESGLLRKKKHYDIIELAFSLDMLDYYKNNWFLTKAEAEARLKELQEKKE